MSPTTKSPVTLVFRKDTYICTLNDLPAGKTITFGVGSAREIEFAPGQFIEKRSFQRYLAVNTKKKTQTVKLTMYAPGARLSRAFWLGIPPLVVMSILVVVVVQGARRHRRRAE